MFKCKKCGEIFETPAREPMEKDTGWQGMRCPHCQSENFRMARHCPICGEWTTQDYCEECYGLVADRLEKLRLELDAKKDDFEDIVANHFGW